MHNDAVESGPGQDDLYSVYCDLYGTVRDWLADGAALHLDDLMASITAMERLDDLLDMELIERHGPLVAAEPTVRSVIDRARDTLQKRLTRRHLNEATLRRLGGDLRGAMTDMQKAVGGLESRASDIDDLKHRIAVRKQIHAVTDLQKRIRRFADTLSMLHDLRWESTFSTTRVEITPKQDVVYRPIQSAILQLAIPEAASVESRVENESIVAVIEGTMQLSVAGHPGVPDTELSKVVVDKMEGLTILGREGEIHITKNGTTPDVQVRNVG